MRTQGSFYLSTYAKLALSDWPVITQLIYQLTASAELIAKGEIEVPSSVLLSDSQLTEIFSGPYQSFFKEKIVAYAAIARVRSKLITSQQEFFKNDVRPGAADAPIVDSLPIDLVTAFTPGALNNLNQQLDQLTLEHYQQWQDAITYWKNGITQYLNQSNVTLSEIETNEFFDAEAANVLLNRFTDLQIAPPKMKNGCNCFGVYLKLKTILAINSSLSRRLQPHGEADIKPIIAPLLPYFADVEKYEKQMLEHQRQATMQIIDPVAFALAAS